MQVQGKLVVKLDVESGTGKTGNEWKKQTFVIETDDQYPKKIAIDVWGDNIEKLEKVEVDQVITAHINVESREYNERWFTNVTSWRIEVEEEKSDHLIDEANSGPKDDKPF